MSNKKVSEVKNFAVLGAELLKYFTLVLGETVEIMVEGTRSTVRGKDLVDDYVRLIEIMRTSQNHCRFVYQPLLFIKQHRNLLCHGYCGCRVVDVKRCLASIGDVIVWLKTFYPSRKDLIKKYIRFYDAYYLCATKECYLSLMKENFETPDQKEIEEKKEEVKEDEKELPAPPKPVMAVSEDFDPFAVPLPLLPPVSAPSPLHPVLEVVENVPPLHTIPRVQTIHWFKVNNLAGFLRQKVIVPQEGSLKGLEFSIERYNGNNCLARLLTKLTEEEKAAAGIKETHKFITRYMPIEWKDDISPRNGSFCEE